MFEGVEVEGLLLVDSGEVHVRVAFGTGDCKRADCPCWWGCGVPVGELGDVEHGVIDHRCFGGTGGRRKFEQFL